MVMSETFDGRGDGASEKSAMQRVNLKLIKTLINSDYIYMLPPDSRKSSSIVDRDDESIDGKLEK